MSIDNCDRHDKASYRNSGNGLGWSKVTRHNPCPVCDKPDWCSMKVTAEKTIVNCRRISNGREKIDTNGAPYYVYFLDGRPDGWNGTAAQPTRPANSSPSRKRTKPVVNWAGIAEELAKDVYLQPLADSWGVSVGMVAELGIGELDVDAIANLCPASMWFERSEWTIPERDGKGQITGIKLRPKDGSRPTYYEGSTPGLVFAPDALSVPGPILLVEGASDTAAGGEMGLAVIGRPNNIYGVNQLAELLATVPADRPIIVVGENDQNEKDWPGRDGAERTAQRLAERLSRPILWALPPTSTKDLREWFNAKNADLENVELLEFLGEEFTALLLAAAHKEQPPTVQAVETDPTALEIAPAELPPEQWLHEYRKRAVKLLEAAKAEWCPDFCKVHLRKGTKDRCMPVSCHGWKCEVCSKTQKRKWLVHFIETFASEEKICLWQGSIKDWQTARKQLVDRLGGSAFRIRVSRDSDTVTIYCNRQIKGSAPFNSTRAALEHAEQTIQGITLQAYKPITASGSWTAPAPNPRGEWVFMGVIPTPVHQIKRYLKDHQIPHYYCAAADNAPAGLEWDLETIPQLERLKFVRFLYADNTRNIHVRIAISQMENASNSNSDNCDLDLRRFDQNSPPGEPRFDPGGRECA